MTPQQYERLTELFHAAMEIAPRKRAAFLDQVSDTDTDLRRELESLLSTQGEAFAEKLPDDIAAGFLAQQFGVSSLAPNTRLDRYEIRALLGKGGMGEVYLAEDVRLHRKVALKILPAKFASNQDRMRRFEQEAQAAAALNHPNIAHIYEIGESEDTHFIAIEYIDGDTLRERIHRDKNPLPKILKYLIQVAEGLAKAHAAGIVHRDLKPDNIMITRDDYAKILDFGLAKLIESESTTVGHASVSSERGSTGMSRHSMAGMVMGTAGYMSPEQAQGKVDEIDQRSDIFSFGCILFEAVTGRKAFPDRSALKSLSKVGHETSPLIAEYISAAPADLERIVQRCLAKDREERYQSIQEVAIELEAVRPSIAEADPHTAVQSVNNIDPAGWQTSKRSTRSTSAVEYLSSAIRQHKQGAVMAGVLGVVLIATVVAFLPRRGRKSSRSTPNVTLRRLTPDVYAIGPTLSPDGRYLAYTKWDNGRTSIWLKDMRDGTAVQTLAPSEDGYGGVQFPPDGAQLYYFRHTATSPNATIFRMPLFGGPSQVVAYDTFSPIAFAPDGKQLAFVRNGTVIVADAEGKGERDLISVTSGAESFVAWGSQLSWSPDGSRIAVCGERKEQQAFHAALFEIFVSDGTMHSLPIPNWNAIDDVVWLRDGSNMYVTAQEKEGGPYQIWRVAYPSGQATAVTNDSNDYEGISLTADGRTMVADQKFSRQTLWLASVADATPARQLTTGPLAADGISGIAFHPDGTIIFTSPRGGNIDLWRMNADGSHQEQITVNNGSFNRAPRVTPDGRYIVFVSSRSGIKHVWRMDADGRNAVRLTDEANGADNPYPSTDGQWVYYSTFAENKFVVMKVSINGGEVFQMSGEVSTLDAIPSPDGRLLACGVYVDKAESPWKVAIISVESRKRLALLDIPAFRGLKRWTSDSRSLVYINNSTQELWQQPIDGQSPTKFYAPNDRIGSFAISPDFSKIACSLGHDWSEGVLIENFDEE